jgi:hypothetical protein
MAKTIAIAIGGAAATAAASAAAVAADVATAVIDTPSSYMLWEFIMHKI